MKKLILILGDLAAGKSTTADILSTKYEITAIKKDTIKEILGDTIGFSNREENLRLSRATFEIMLHIFDRASLAGEDLILESNFREAELERLTSLAEAREYSVLSLLLTADTEVLYQRYLERLKNGRHAVHQNAGFDSYEGFVEYVCSQRKAPKLGKVVKIDATSFDYQKDPAFFATVEHFLFGKHE